jgi:hypothetical protein
MHCFPLSKRGLDLSSATIGRFLADAHARPHKVRGRLNRADEPGFWARAGDVCRLCLDRRSAPSWSASMRKQASPSGDGAGPVASAAPARGLRRHPVRPGRRRSHTTQITANAVQLQPAVTALLPRTRSRLPASGWNGSVTVTNDSETSSGLNDRVVTDVLRLAPMADPGQPRLHSRTQAIPGLMPGRVHWSSIARKLVNACELFPWTQPHRRRRSSRR